MKVTGFTFIRNAIKYDYPVVEAIRSVLPLCDDFVVAVGRSEDATLELIQSIDPGKIKILETVWDDSIREGGRVLAEETNKAFRAIAADTDWCFYIQGDELLHEKYHEAVRKAMLQWKDNKEVDGLLFKYLHFYGSYDYVGTSASWYAREIRVVRNDKSIYSYRDAQGFRKGDNEKLRVKPVDAYIYHYGWVKDPRAMQLKQEDFNKLWHDDKWVEQHIVKADEFNYLENIDALEKFTGTHPRIMQGRIAKRNWKFDYDISYNKLSLKDKLKKLAFKWFGLEFGYRNYKVLR
jgi:hypothetical protein